MAREDWQALVRKYANGRDICNCGDAYYANDGEYIVTGVSGRFYNGKHCKYGCSTNILNARDEIASLICKSLTPLATDGE